MNQRVLYLWRDCRAAGPLCSRGAFYNERTWTGSWTRGSTCCPSCPRCADSARTWCKFTIACFRFTEVQRHFEDEGWTVRPLLVVRDVRAVFDSLIRKPWGRNGTTADDPPLRLRMRRFREDWESFRQNNWPVLCYEDLVSDGVGVLRKACDQLELPWDEGMVSWPKPADRIADPKFGNPTFADSRSQGLLKSLKPSLASVATKHIPPDDLQWLESEFAEMNKALGYALRIPPAGDPSQAERRAVPRFENSRRYERLQRKHRIARFFKGIGEKFTRSSGRPLEEASADQPKS